MARTCPFFAAFSYLVVCSRTLVASPYDRQASLARNVHAPRQLPSSTAEAEEGCVHRACARPSALHRLISCVRRRMRPAACCLLQRLPRSPCARYFLVAPTFDAGAFVVAYSQLVPNQPRARLFSVTALLGVP